MTENELTLVIKLNEKTSKHNISGTLTSGMVKMMVGEIELVKLKLINNLGESLEKAGVQG